MLNKWRIGAVLLVMCFYSSGTVAATEKQKDREHLNTHLSSSEKRPSAANDNLDNLIYSFNNKSISINNWISLRSFINKIFSSYPG